MSSLSKTNAWRQLQYVLYLWYKVFFAKFGFLESGGEIYADLRYKIEDGAITIIRYEGEVGMVSIPPGIEGKPEHIPSLIRAAMSG